MINGILWINERGFNMSLGGWGENVAERYLKKKGYVIVGRNFRCRYGELDIIAMDGAELVFVEVKTRRNLNFGLPCEAVTAAKIRHMKRVAAYYISTCPVHRRSVRLDVIEILLQEERIHINHIENILV